MARVFVIRNSGDIQTTLRALSRIHTRIPQIIPGGGRKWGEVLVRDLKNVAFNEAGIKDFSGTLSGTGIRWEQGKKSTVGRLFMAQHGVFLDSMRNHFVNITRRRTRLLKWALQASSPRIRGAAQAVASGVKNKHPIFVKKHPFIARGYRRARPKLRRYYVKNINNVILTS